ncbi:MAG: hypothetical protein P4L56_01000 [Candidatus Sulfopaludibacter sp.]|nr:hypothetical protein [Candidatus Sulfopaludibacter sp.]
MKPANPCILTINGGSSSIKFAEYQLGEPLKRRLHGTVDRIGLSGTHLTFRLPEPPHQDTRLLDVFDHKSAATFLSNWLEEQDGCASVQALGHRIVHGMHHTAPELVTQELLDELHRISRYDPDHLPSEIELIEVFRQRHPKLPQVACFETAHRTMPRVAKLLPIPRCYDEKGVQRPKCGMTLEPKTATAGTNDDENAELRDMTQRFWFGAALALPVFVLAMVHLIPALARQPWVGGNSSRWLQFRISGGGRCAGAPRSSARTPCAQPHGQRYQSAADPRSGHRAASRTGRRS